jgi:hypothetical protein
MSNKKAMEESPRATLSNVKKEMARLRVAKSARKKYSKLGPAMPLTTEEKRLVVKR